MKLLGRGNDAAFWQEVREKDTYKRYRDELLQYWDKTGKDYVPTVLPYSHWKLYWITGDRGAYERAYFSRRFFIEHVTLLSVIYPEEPLYRERLQDVLFAVMDEYTWCLPAHQGQNDHYDNDVIDLFAAETGYYLALVDTLLGDRLEPLIRDRIRVEVNDRIFVPFVEKKDVRRWESWTNNWCAVCTCGVGCAMMLLRPELVDDAMQTRLVDYMKQYLGGFADDGICTEGCAYWMYGVGFFAQFSDMLYHFTEGKINLFREEKVRAIAAFPQKMFLSEHCGVSFADGSPGISYDIGISHRLKEEYPDDVLIYSPEYGKFEIGCGRFSVRLYGAIWLNEAYWNHPADASVPFESYAENSQWLTKKCQKYGFAAKAGHNGEMHNHNDVGSFIYAKNGRQFLADIGSGCYTAQYFSDKRYEILEPSARSHSVPIIGGEYQFAGREAAARDVIYTKGKLSMDIAGAYKSSALQSLRRTFIATDDGITVKDEYTLREPIEIIERFISTVEPKQIADGVLEIGTCHLTYDPTVCTYSLDSEVTTRSSTTTCYFMDFRLHEGVRNFQLEIQ